MSKKKIYTDQELAERKRKKAEYMKAWKEKNAAHVKKYNDAYFEENREYNKERCKAYKRNNPEKIYQQNKNWNINNRIERNRHNKKWRIAHPEYRPDYMLGYNYNLTLDDYNEILAAQGGHCAICPAMEPVGRVRRLAVDHDTNCCSGRKSCGKCVRGLLCTACNTAIGGARHNVEILEKMILYLKRTKWVNAKGEVRANPKKDSQ
jgi:hypothetical protein